MSKEQKALYVVLHHKEDPNRPWQNSWLDEDRIDAITTTREIGDFCRAAMKRNEPVFVHRCGYGESAPTVCCAAHVADVSPIDRHTDLVRFKDAKVVNAAPPVGPHPGQNFYFAAAVGI